MLASTVPPTGWVLLFLALVLGGLPGGAFHSWLRLKMGKPPGPKRKLYLGMLLMQAALLGLAWKAAQASKLDLFPAWSPTLRQFAVCGILLAGMLYGATRSWERTSEDHKKRARLFVPETRRQLAAWSVLVLLVAFAEEAAYRGTLFWLLGLGMGRNWGMAWLVANLAFAAAHMTQGWKGVLGTFLIGITFQYVVFLTGDLYLAIAVHYLYNVGFGIMVVKSVEAERGRTLQAGAT